MVIANVPLPNYLMVFEESDEIRHVRLDQMDCMRLSISIAVQNALWDNKIVCDRSSSVNEKNGLNLSNHE